MPNNGQNSSHDIRGILREVLRDAGGDWVSGEELSRRLGVSRAAVSKHMRVLREEGHGIESVTRKGYRLICEADSLQPEVVRAGLRTQSFGRGEFLHLPTTASTNMEAMALALRGAPEGTVVVADEQTQGRGRKGREWRSPAGYGLYVSLVLRPELTPEAAPVVTLLTNVVIAETLAELTGITPVCKWPNDVLLHGRKVAGNLTEVFMVADSVAHIVTGAGINVHPLPETARSGLRTPPISIAEAVRVTGEGEKPLPESGGEEAPATCAISRLSLLRAFLAQYEHWYRRMQAEGIAPVIARWKELTDVVGRTLRVEARLGVVEGVVTDVTADGMLVLRTADGREEQLFSGDIVDG
ncbi:biotin--[acetyl-CoA-carboxylase] ligase [Desulfovibrio subterraneus]|uniref:Bifunctional ligase/repressor BirA n=1 Tax=Desulfovibrio subterraneus TaxID=2718620 RepID=A0A7J0BMV9_9BACT|nr:biotin--[acetyl-CoA-carboxylase] ligase [Desulfovibrio subterraneus]GFM35020.1 bifunctional ligase/repressor BirA [Desulfovibrio subterraneus]